MRKYLLRRFIQALITIWGAITVVFLMIRVTGDPVRMILSPEASEEQVAALRESLGLNQPLGKQYLDYLSDVLHGNLGDSFTYKQSALKVLMERMPATFQLALTAILMACVVGILFGIISVLFKNGIIDAITGLFVTTGQSIPVFWLGIMLIMIFSVKLGIFPTSGADKWNSIILPAISLAAYPAATVTKLMRSNLLEVMGQDYIRTARAKGMGMWRVIFSQAIKNAFIPVLTVIGLEFGSLLGGAVVTETVFAWPGIGRVIIQAVYARDFPLVQAGILVVSFVFVFINFLVDVGYTLLDPRIKYN